MKRPAVISFRCTEEEKAKFIKAAKKIKLKLADFVYLATIEKSN